MISDIFYEVFVDGTTVVFIVGSVAGFVTLMYNVYVKQKRIQRDMYGASDDKTRPGVLERQRQMEHQIDERLGELESQVDERFDTMEEHMNYRHREIAVALRQIMHNMDDPPNELNIRGPYDTGDDLDE